MNATELPVVSLPHFHNRNDNLAHRIQTQALSRCLEELIQDDNFYDCSRHYSNVRRVSCVSVVRVFCSWRRILPASKNYD